MLISKALERAASSSSGAEFSEILQKVCGFIISSCKPKASEDIYFPPCSEQSGWGSGSHYVNNDWFFAYNLRMEKGVTGLFVVRLFTVGLFTVGHFAVGHFTVRTFCCTDILLYGHFAVRTLRSTDTSLYGHFALRTLRWDDTPL